MNYSILTGTDFFLSIHTHRECPDFEKAYHEFVEKVFDLCTECSEPKPLLLAMTYTEVELQHLCRQEETEERQDEKDLYIHKALAFIRKTLRYISAQVPPLLSNSNLQKVPQPSPFRWTGNTVDLIEFIYGLDEMKCLNEGETAINELVAFFGSLFGLEIKDNQCYNTYADIKRRKNDSRTYFIDRMQERLNLRMRRDDAREAGRR